MKQGLILLLAVFTLAASMVPRDRRAINTDEEEEQLSQSTTSKVSEKQKEICAPQTPCAWFLYKPNSKYIEMNITNSYCECSADKTCQYSEENVSTFSYVYRCRPPADELEAATES